MSFETKQFIKGSKSTEDDREYYAPTRSNFVHKNKRHYNSESNTSTDEETTSDTYFKIPPWWTKEDPRLPEYEKPYRLQSFVRSKYLMHLQKLLQTNYENCIDYDPTQDLPEFSDLDFEECATAMEIKAVQACMVVSLYRKAMLRMIGEIRNETNRFKLYRKLKIFKKSRQDASTQTMNSIDKLNTVRPIHATKVHLSNLSATPLPKKIDFDTDLETYALNTSSNVTKFSKRSNRPEKLSLDDRLVHLLNDKPKIEHVEILKPQHFYKIDSRKKYCRKQEVNRVVKEKHIYRKPKIRPAIKPNSRLSYESNNKVVDTRTVKPREPKTWHTIKEEPEKLERETSIEVTEMNQCPPEEDTSNDVPEDNLMKELEEMFKENENDNPENEIFNICENDDQIKGIINEINKSKCIENIKTEKVDNCKIESIENTNSTINTVEKDDQNNENEKKEMCDKKNSNPFLLKNGKYSLWPCELHMQRRRLRLLLDTISEINPRKRDQLRIKFIMLFDEDSEDEQAIEDPIVDKIHELSCKERIANWVVRSVMPHYINQQIKGKELFKSVSRHLAQTLIYANPYPDKEEVYDYIRNYFQKRSVIRTHQDIFVKVEEEQD